MKSFSHGRVSELSYVQIIVGGAWRKETGWSGVSLVAYNGEGHIVAHSAASCFSSSLFTEIWAIHFAVKWVLHNNFNAQKPFSYCVHVILKMWGSGDTF